jgi:hypothetical protein
VRENNRNRKIIHLLQITDVGVPENIRSQNRPQNPEPSAKRPEKQLQAIRTRNVIRDHVEEVRNPCIPIRLPPGAVHQSETARMKTHAPTMRRSPSDRRRSTKTGKD